MSQVAAPKRTQKKTWLSRSRAWISIVLLTPAAVVAAFSAQRIMPGSWVAFGFECLGWFLFLLGAFYRWWATLYIGGRKGDELVTDGPYSTCRNPLYFGTFLMILAIAAFTQSLVWTAAVLVVSVYYFAVTVPGEEGRLQDHHGDAFVNYRRRVPAFLPRFSNYQSPESVNVRMVGLHAEFLRSLRWMCLPFLCELLMHLRSEAWWPHWFPPL